MKPSRASLLFAASLLISALFLVALPRSLSVNESSDFRGAHEPVARNVLAGRGLVDRPGHLAVRYPPGYALVVAGVFWIARTTGVPESALLIVVGVVGMSVSALLVFAIAAQLWGSNAALFSWLAWTTYPLALYLLKQPNSEIPFLVAMLGAVYCVVGIVQGRDTGLWRMAACGFLIGVAMLIRPIAIGLGAVLAVLVLLGAPRRRTVAAVILLAGNVVAIAPWEALVYGRTGSIVALSSASPASLRDGLTFAVRSKGFREGVWVPERTREVMQHISDQYPALVSARAVGRVLAYEFAEHPVGVLQLAALKVARSWYGTDSQRQDTMILGLQALYLAVISAASAIGWRSGGVARRAIVAAWTIAAYFWAMSIASTSLVRYMVPAMSLLFVIVPAVRSRALGDQGTGSEAAL